LSDCLEILLVEDDPQDAFLLRKAVAEAGSGSFELVCVERLGEGMQQLEEGEFDAVLLDLSLPDSRGLETFSRLYGSHPGVPIVVLTGVDDDALALKAVQAGAQDYLVKGQVGHPLLERAIRYAIERNNLQVELEQTREREREERERTELMRSRQVYLAITRDQEAASPEPRLDLEKVLDGLFSEYQDLVLRYVRAMRIQEDRPAEPMRAFARRLAGMHTRAGDVVHLHLRVLDAISRRILPNEQRALANDARLALVELMGDLADIYLHGAFDRENDSRTADPEPESE